MCYGIFYYSFKLNVLKKLMFDLLEILIWLFAFKLNNTENSSTASAAFEIDRNIEGCNY